jgi:hypothetical protein
MTPEEKRADSLAKAEGKRSRQRLIDAFMDVLTREDSPIDADTLRSIRACWMYFPQGKDLVDRIEKLYPYKKFEELRKSVLLSAILACLERLIA